MSSPATTEIPQAGFRPWHFFVLASLLAATAAVLLAPRPTPEHLVLISLTLAAAGLVAAAFHRTLLPLFTPTADLLSEPLGRRSRAALEREKALILRSIKELEFDRAMGKVAEEDFNEMVARLRGRAMAIMKQLEAGTSYRDMIEKDLAKRIGAGVSQQSSASVSPGVSEVRSPKPETSLCACGTRNDPDARFCKSCGARLEVV